MGIQNAADVNGRGETVFGLNVAGSSGILRVRDTANATSVVQLEILRREV